MQSYPCQSAVTMAPSASSSVVDAGRPTNPEDITPEDFLRSIRELSNRRDREDMERYQMLEAEAEKRRARKAGQSIASHDSLRGRAIYGVTEGL